MRKIEFVSYDGKYPNLCGGTLKLRVDGEEWESYFCLGSGGSCEIDEDGEEHVSTGPWELYRWKFEEDFTKDEIEKIKRLVNDNVEWGCCGGCI